MLRGERGSTLGVAEALALAVGDAGLGDGGEPGGEGAGGVVGVAHAVQREQDVLHRVLRFRGIGQGAAGAGAQAGRDGGEQGGVGPAVAFLGAGHEGGPGFGARRIV